MARLARLVVPHHPHHVTQRGALARAVFEGEEDYQLYLDILSAELRRTRTEMWCYCLLPSHVHMILSPAHEQGLALTLGETHRRYSTIQNARRRMRGKLFKSRFSSVVLDDDYLIRAVCYVSLNPVRARLVDSAAEWPWSSVKAHLSGKDSPFVVTGPVLRRCSGRFDALLETGMTDTDFAPLRSAERTGRPLGSEVFLDRIAALTGRDARPQKRGRKNRVAAD